MKDLPVGARGRFVLTVAPEHLANRYKDRILPAVLATPVLIMMMENAALDAMKPYLDPGEAALGTRVDIEHVAATPVGRTVVGEAEVTRVDGRRVGFAVRVLDGNEVVGRGTHERVLIDVARFQERLRARYAKDRE